MTFEQFQKRWRRLAFWRQEWVREKARIEGCTLWGVLESWEPPSRQECERMLRR